LGIEDRIEIFCRNFSTEVIYEQKKHHIAIALFDREFKLHKNPDDPDDIGEIDSHGMTIDIAPVIREEIIMACHML
jgi:hypothetical protein